jgi:hypothetical protein
MNIFFPVQLVYQYIVYILTLIINSIKSLFGGNSNDLKKIKWNEDDNTVHYTYSKEEYDRTMYKNTNILPFTNSDAFNNI